jgi:NADPH:quinone reductase-like Zn-dependent oxidoreductase
MGNDDEFDAVVAEFRAGRLPPVIDSEFSLDDGRAAFERLGAPARFGKVVVHVS